MDVSREYIKMCEKAVKIQEQWIPQYGDRFADEHLKIDEHTQGWDIYCGQPLTFCAIWLPRQDQLQKMSGLTWFIFYGQCRYFYKISEGNISAEQAGLMVVMMEKYNKVWNGEDWVEA